MFKLDFVLDYIERYYFPFLVGLGYETHYDYRPYKITVWIDGNDLDYAQFFSLSWERTVPVDFYEGAVHFFSVESEFLDGEKEIEIIADEDAPKDLLREISAYLVSIMKNIFVHTVATLAPDKWFVAPNQPVTLFYRHTDFPITVDMRGDPPVFVLTGKSLPSQRLEVEVEPPNLRSVLEILVNGENIPQNFRNLRKEVAQHESELYQSLG
jgi:hypothetical protein